MKLKSLGISGFRGIRTLELEFPEQINVLVGVNGAGKTAILDCTAIMLSRLIGRIRSSSGKGRSFSDLDINNGASETRNEIEICSRGDSVRWSVSKSRRGLRRQKITNHKELKKHVKQFHSRLEGDERTTLPLAVYYPVNRAVLDIPLRIRKRHPFDRLAAYDEALSGEPGAWSSFRVFFEWFRNREDLENEQRLTRRRYRDPQLEAVRKATNRLLPGFANLRIRRSPLRMVVKKDGNELIVNQLSDGEKCTLAMTGDLARRMAIANPAMKNPLESEGIVLIDEIDLHLHPGWQRRVVPALQRTFPNCQFLLSTHSPQILGHLRPESIWMLENASSGIVARRPDDAYGQTTNRVLEDIMDVPARPREVRDRLTDLFVAIEEGKMKKAKRLLSDMRKQIGTDPDLVKASVLIQRREALEE